MPDDDYSAGVVPPGVHDFTVGNRIDPRPSGITPNSIPVFARMPEAGIVPGILNRDPVTNKETVAKWLARRSDRVAERHGGRDRCRGWRRYRCGNGSSLRRR